MTTDDSQSPGYFFQSVSGTLDAVLKKYYEALPAIGDTPASEEQATALVREIGKIASVHLEEGVRAAFARMNAEGAGSMHGAAELREMTERALEYFVQALGTPLMPIALKSRARSWAVVEQAADQVNAALAQELDELKGG